MKRSQPQDRGLSWQSWHPNRGRDSTSCGAPHRHHTHRPHIAPPHLQADTSISPNG